jgi:hypothetical protein
MNRKVKHTNSRDKSGRFVSDQRRAIVRLIIGLAVALLLVSGVVKGLAVYEEYEAFKNWNGEFVSPEPDNRPPTPKERKETTETIYYRYLKAKGSPFANLAPLIYEIEERYNLPRYLLISVSGAESSFGLHCRAYNPFGWGPHIPFNSWEEAFETVASKLASLPAYATWRQEKENIALLALTYNPQDNPRYWVQKVKTFREEMVDMQFVKEDR